MTDLREDLLPLFLVAESVSLQEMRLEREATLLKGMLDGFLDLFRVVSDVLLARALRYGRHQQSYGCTFLWNALIGTF